MNDEVWGSIVYENLYEAMSVQTTILSVFFIYNSWKLI